MPQGCVGVNIKASERDAGVSYISKTKNVKASAAMQALEGPRAA